MSQSMGVGTSGTDGAVPADGRIVESSIDALQRFEAECGWSDAPWLMAQSSNGDGEGQCAAGAGPSQ